jgi:hypothetical protein
VSRVRAPARSLLVASDAPRPAPASPSRGLHRDKHATAIGRVASRGCASGAHAQASCLMGSRARSGALRGRAVRRATPSRSAFDRQAPTQAWAGRAPARYSTAPFASEGFEGAIGKAEDPASAPGSERWREAVGGGASFACLETEYYKHADGRATPVTFKSWLLSVGERTRRGDDRRTAL